VAPTGIIHSGMTASRTLAVLSAATAAWIAVSSVRSGALAEGQTHPSRRPELSSTSQPLPRETIPRRFHGVWVFHPSHCTSSLQHEHIRVAERQIERGPMPPHRSFRTLSAMTIRETSPPTEESSVIIETRIGNTNEFFELRLVKDFRYPDPLFRFGKLGGPSAEFLHRCRLIRP
jgi:hypothetical protein